MTLERKNIQRKANLFTSVSKLEKALINFVIPVATINSSYYFNEVLSQLPSVIEQLPNVYTIYSRNMELIHTHQKLLSLTWRSTVVNFWTLTSILLLCYISVTLEAKIWKYNQFQNTPLEDLNKRIVDEWNALPQNVTSRKINLFRKHVRMVIKKKDGHTEKYI